METYRGGTAGAKSRSSYEQPIGELPVSAKATRGFDIVRRLPAEVQIDSGPIGCDVSVILPLSRRLQLL